jgi:hypothetical protein
VQVAFSQRRKMLRNTLGKWLEEKGFAGTFDLQRRAEEVPVAEYLALALRSDRLPAQAGTQASQRKSPAVRGFFRSGFPPARE